MDMHADKRNSGSCHVLGDNRKRLNTSEGSYRRQYRCPPVTVVVVVAEEEEEEMIVDLDLGSTSAETASSGVVPIVVMMIVVVEEETTAVDVVDLDLGPTSAETASSGVVPIVVLMCHAVAEEKFGMMLCCCHLNLPCFAFSYGYQENI